MIVFVWSVKAEFHSIIATQSHVQSFQVPQKWPQFNLFSPKWITFSLSTKYGIIFICSIISIIDIGYELNWNLQLVSTDWSLPRRTERCSLNIFDVPQSADGSEHFWQLGVTWMQTNLATVSLNWQAERKSVCWRKWKIRASALFKTWSALGCSCQGCVAIGIFCEIYRLLTSAWYFQN